MKNHAIEPTEFYPSSAELLMGLRLRAYEGYYGIFGDGYFVGSCEVKK